MRTLLSILIAAALVAAAPVHAQRASLADRVTALEARAANDRGNVDLLNQVQQMRTELQALRSQVEELQQQNEQLRTSGRSQYLDLDGRLNRLEGAGSAPPPVTRPTTPTPAPGAGKPAVGAPAVSASAAVGDRAPSVHGDRGTLAQGAGERAAYDAAFAKLRAGEYVEASRAFAGFLDQYPSGVYAPNALYWLGESYYVTQNYTLALPRFQAVLDRYPTHDKAAGAMLKVGLSQLGLKQLDAAERTLAAVVEKYPGSDAARTAADQLQSLRLAKIR